jgi:hypothetical protein
VPPTLVLAGRPVETLLAQTIEIHEQVLSLLRTPNLAQVLLSLYDDEARRRAMENPADAAKDGGLYLPEGTEIYVHEFASGWQAEIHMRQGRGLIILGYSSIRGFYTK